MAVDINEYRRQRIEAAERDIASKSQELVAQAPVDAEFETGNPVIDKLLRAIKVVVDQVEASSLECAKAGMKAPEDKVFRHHQLSYMYMIGKVDGWRELAGIASQVAQETKQNAIILPQ